MVEQTIFTEIDEETGQIFVADSQAQLDAQVRFSKLRKRK